MTNRKRNSREKLAEEFFHVQFFLIEHLRIKTHSKLLVNDIFVAYQKWRERQDKQPTILSVDSFGRFFPRHYKRKNIRVGSDTGRGLENMVLVGI